MPSHHESSAFTGWYSKNPKLIEIFTLGELVECEE